MWQEYYAQIHSIRKTAGERNWGTYYFGWKCASNVLYAIPWGYGREIVNGSEV